MVHQGAGRIRPFLGLCPFPARRPKRTSLPATFPAAPARRARSEIVPASVSGSGSVMYSIPNAATMGRALAAVATVTSPAPARKAAIAASAAAPVLPTEPARISTWPKLPLWASGFRGRAIQAKSSRHAKLKNSSESLSSASGGVPIPGGPIPQRVYKPEERYARFSAP